MNGLVLGAGPSGLMAAWALMERGHEVYILDKDDGAADRLKAGRVNAGVFLLHELCGLLPLRGHARGVRYELLGDAEGYRKKVYPDHPDALVSAQQYAEHGEVRVEFNALDAVELLLDLVGDRIGQTVDVAKTVNMQGEHFVISTIPLSVFVEDPGPSTLVSVKTGEAPAGEGYVWYNGLEHFPWYRASAAFGRFTLEYPGETFEGDVVIRKPIAPSAAGVEFMDMKHEDDWLFTGRFGAWDKTKELDTVYRETREFARYLEKRNA